MRRLLIAALLALLVVAGQLGTRGFFVSSHDAGRDRPGLAGRNAGVSAAIPRLGEIPGAEGEEAEESPEGLSTYLDARFTSGKTVEESQVRRAMAQANAIPTAAVGSWQLVGPSNIGARL